MIDWLSFSLPYDGPPVGVQYLRRETWDAPIEPVYNKPVQVEGSWSSKVTVHAIGGRLYISGNPAKFLTGQNVIGSNDCRRLVAEMLERVIDALGLLDCRHMLTALTDGETNLTRVDCTFAYKVGSDADVVSWLMAMEKACHVKSRGRGHFDPGMCSLMYGLTMEEGKKAKASRRSTFKFYNKWRELQSHPPTCAAADAEWLAQSCVGLVRGEACYRGLELKRLYKDKVKAWNASTAWELHRDWVQRMEIAEMYAIEDKEVAELPSRLRGSYHMWQAGLNVKEVLPRQTFYQHRKRLMEFGIDIANPRPASHFPVQVVPVLRVLEAVPVAEDEAAFWRLAA